MKALYLPAVKDYFYQIAITIMARKRSMRSTLLQYSAIITALLISNIAVAGILASGTIELKKDSVLVSKAKGIRTLFVVIYDLKSKRPMPYGAVKYDLKTDAKGVFHKFELTTENVKQMGGMMGSSVPTELRIKARLDKDGSGGRDRPGDIVGEIKSVKAGSKNLKIVLSTLK